MFNSQTLTVIDIKATKGSDVTKFKSDGALQLQQYIQAMRAQPPSIRRVRYVFMPNGDNALSVFTEALTNFGYLSEDPIVKIDNLMAENKLDVNYLGRDGKVRRIDQQTYAAWRQLATNAEQERFMHEFEATHAGNPIPQFNAE